MAITTIEQLSDTDLIAATIRSAGNERRATAELLALLAELDKRRLYLGQACASLFTFCTQVLRLSEHAAYHRIEAARAARQFPLILKLVADGSITLTTVALLRPHLTRENHERLLAAARHKSKREVEHQIACLAPKPDARTMIRRVPDATPEAKTDPEAKPPATDFEHRDGEPTLELRAEPATPRPQLAPLASDRYLLRVTLSAEAHANLRRAQELMSHTILDGDAAVIIGRALTVLVDQLERTKLAAATRPRLRRTAMRSATRPHQRHIPAAVRRAVWARDQGRCAFNGARGRCTETSRLEFHHLVPFARGGPTDVDNISLRCRAHNSHESELVFGPRA